MKHLKKFIFKNKILFIVLAVVLIGAVGVIIALTSSIADATATREIKTAASEYDAQASSQESSEATPSATPISAEMLSSLVYWKETRRSSLIPSPDGTVVTTAGEWINLMPQNYLELKGKALNKTIELAKGLFGIDITDKEINFDFFTDASKKRADFVKVTTKDDAIVCVLSADTLDLIDIDYYFTPTNGPSENADNFAYVKRSIDLSMTDADTESDLIMANKVATFFGTNVSDIKYAGGIGSYYGGIAIKTFDLTMENGKLVKIANMNDELYAVAVYPTKECMAEWAYFEADLQANQTSPTATPKPTPSATKKPNLFPDEYYGNKINKGEWLYYLDLKNPVQSADSEEPLYNIHRVKKDGTGDENLNVLCFRFDFAGEYLYADTNLKFGDFGHWKTYRYDLNGDGEQQIEYSDMRRFSKGDRLYFALFSEPAFYTATTACTDVEKYEVKVPDDEEIREKLDYNYEETFVKVTDAKNGWVYFEFKVTDTGPMPHYTGNYRMNLSSREIEKLDDGIYE